MVEGLPVLNCDHCGSFDGDTFIVAKVGNSHLCIRCLLEVSKDLFLTTSLLTEHLLRFAAGGYYGAALSREVTDLACEIDELVLQFAAVWRGNFQPFQPPFAYAELSIAAPCFHGVLTVGNKAVFILDEAVFTLYDVTKGFHIEFYTRKRKAQWDPVKLKSIHATIEQARYLVDQFAKHGSSSLFLTKCDTD